ncbi:MAG: hypothetical protein ACXV5Q_01990 [Frankiaceae bacterium]
MRKIMITPAAAIATTLDGSGEAMTRPIISSARRYADEHGAMLPGGHGMSAKQLWFSDEPSLDVAATDGADYRDYLWPIWTVAASNEVGNEVSLSGKDARQELENLIQLLLPPTGVGFGLGVAPGAISRTESVVTQSPARTVMQRIVKRDQHVVDKRQNAFGASPTRKLSVSGSIDGTCEGCISVSLTCKSIEANWSNWHTEVFARISAVYAAQLAPWQSEQGCVHVCSAPGDAPARSASPPHDARPARQVLRQVSPELLRTPT